MDNHERQLLQSAMELLHQLIGYADAKEDFKPILRFVEDDPKVIPFPTNAKPPLAPMQEVNFLPKQKSDVLGTSDEDEILQKGGILQFSEKEIIKMPKQFRKIFRVDKQAAHIRRRNDGYYEIRMQRKGVRFSASARYLDLAKERFIAKLREYDEAGSPRQSPKSTLFLPYILQWLETVKKPYIKPNTYKMYLQLYNAYLKPKFDGKKLASLTQFELQGFINEFGADGKNRTAQKVALLLSAVLDYAVGDGIIERSPMKRVIVARYEEEHGQSLTREEEKTLISAFNADPNVYAQAYVFILYTGIRRGELASAKLQNGWVSVRTGKQRMGIKEKWRRIPVCPMLNKLLPQIDIAAIKAISPGMLTKHIKDYLPTHHCHDLRHTFITRAQECGIKRELVSLWAGHAADTSITSTVYTHLEQNETHQIKEMSLFSYDLI